MNKSELMSRVQFATSISAPDAKNAVQEALNQIAGALAHGDNVTLVGFGTFKLSARAARVGRNPRTGEAVDVPAGKRVTFKASQKLKDSL